MVSAPVSAPETVSPAVTTPSIPSHMRTERPFGAEMQSRLFAGIPEELAALASTLTGPSVPVYIRVGNAPERLVGAIETPADLPAFLRAVADEAEGARTKGPVVTDV